MPLRTETERPLPVRVERCERERPDMVREEREEVVPECDPVRADGTALTRPVSAARPHSSQ
ncbi:hypothetical protein GCM10020229_58680 [Kitasatospora albolonga]